MTLLLRDSINAPLIPKDTPVVAGYGDGKYIWSPSWLDGSNWFDLFPASLHLVIVVNAAHAGDVLDVETGDATPADVPGWCDRFNRPGRRAPTIYCDRNTWPLVQQAVGNRRVDYWIGTLDGTKVVPGAVAVQYVDTGAYDESIIQDPAWVGFPSDPPTTGGGAMAGFVSRDVNNVGFDEVYVSGGEALWGAYPGGAGDWINPATAPPTNLGSPTDTKDLIEANGAFTQGRLNVRATRRDGIRWIKVMNLADFTVAQDWTIAGAGPSADPPPAAAYVRHKHNAQTDTGTPA